MLPESVLASAKAFLCWEAFNDLSIQLVPIQKAAAYYYPPENPHQSIVLFYDPALRDFSEPLFLLFHEAGHARQRKMLSEENRAEYFQKMIDLDKGEEKVEFEKKAWELGQELFDRFVRKENLGRSLLAGYDLYGAACVETYKISTEGKSER